jgi:hypothetical protein
MQLYKYRLCIFIFFISIFVLKMVVSAVPLLFDFSQYNTKSIILDLQQEHNAEGDTKGLLKDSDCRNNDFHYHYQYIPLLQESGIKNCFIDHYKRYVNTYHPTVPTPPPDSNVIETSLI